MNRVALSISPWLLASFLGLVSLAPAAADARPGEILPTGVAYDPAIPTPASSLGFEVGERHARHDQLLAYMEELAAASDRVRIERQGLTHEKRPLVLLTISSPGNLARLEEIRQRHLGLSEGGGAPAPEDDPPVVVWLGYSIHGNEASGSNASLLVAYHLAAARDAEVESFLEHAVILLDPSLNPDGLGRFAQWANMYRGTQPVGDPASREHQEAWPGGRTNHYWFDLNRDWLLLQHPESKARVATFQRWRPNVVSDFHEMDGDSTYFFQPGVPSRRNPLTPARNAELTREISRYHAAALDREGRLYFTEERFDDFYYGKGSTYPDAQGAIGILFEQASVRGHLRQTEDGPMEFAFAISNQFLTSLSTVRAAVEKRRELLEYQNGFYREGREEARRLAVGAYVFGSRTDPARTFRMAEILRLHDIELHHLARPHEDGESRFEPGAAYVVPVEQRQSRLVRTLFERVREFQDSIFYDVSTWTLPLAFGLPYAELPRERSLAELIGPRVETLEPPRGRLELGPEAYAYAFEWSSYFAPRALGRLLAAGVKTRVAALPFEAETTSGRRGFDRGTILVPLGTQDVSPESVRAALEAAAREDAVDVHALTTGLTPAGVDLGSPNVRLLKRPRPLLVIGEGVSSSEAGEVWHLLDHRFGLEVSLIPADALGRLELGRYTHIVMVDGDYGGISQETRDALTAWVRAGGTLITTQRAAQWVLGVFPGIAASAAGTGDPDAAEDRKEGTQRLAYGDYDTNRGAQRISGAILEADLDRTHPLAFGFDRSRLPVFRNSTRLLAPSANPYENVAVYTDRPVLSGYISQANEERLRGAAALTAGKEGKGAVIRFADDPGFRGFWYGTQKLLLNALYFAPILESRVAPSNGREE